MNPTKLEQRETRRPKGVVTLWPQEVTIGNEKQPSILQVYNLARKQIISKLLKTGLAKRSQFTFLFSKKFRKYLILLSAFCLIIWLMKSPNSFEKIAILKI